MKNLSYLAFFAGLFSVLTVEGQTFKPLVQYTNPGGSSVQDVKNSLQTVGRFNYARVLNTSGTMQYEIFGLANTLQKSAGLWQNGGNAPLSSGYVVELFFEIDGIRYVSTEEPPYLRKLNTINNNYEDVGLGLAGPIGCGYKWTPGSVLIGLNGTPTSIWDITSNSLTPVPDGGFEPSAKCCYIDLTQTFYFAFRSAGAVTIWTLQKGTMTFVKNSYPLLPCNRLLGFWVDNANQMYLIVGTNAQKYELHRYSNGVWTKQSTFTPVNYLGTSQPLKAMFRRNGLTYVAITATAVDGQPRNGVFTFNEATGTSANIAPVLPAELNTPDRITNMYADNDTLLLAAIASTIGINGSTLYKLDQPLIHQPVYVFTGNGNWDVDTNWSNNAMPPSTLPDWSQIIIDHQPGGQCILNVPYTISNTSSLIVKPMKTLVIPGNLILQ